MLLVCGRNWVILLVELPLLCVYVCECVCVLSHSDVSDTLQPHGLCSLPGSSVHLFSRQEYWSGLPFPSPGVVQTQGSTQSLPVSPAWTGRFFTPEPLRKPPFTMCLAGRRLLVSFNMFLCPPQFLKCTYLCLAVLGLCCCGGFSPVAASGGYSLFAKHRLLTAVVSRVEHGL